RQNRETLLMRDGRVAIVPLEVVWGTETEMVSRTEQPLDAPVIVTALGQATEGMRVSLPGQKPDGGQGGRPGAGASGPRETGRQPAGPVPDAEQASLRDVTPESTDEAGVDTGTDTNPAGPDAAVRARTGQPDAAASREN
ncbi:MAG: hypothetical protein KDI15_05980, partial [Thiothrix sp.]|nr:hypothetical protein [Thiothrix sp.]